MFHPQVLWHFVLSVENQLKDDDETIIQFLNFFHILAE